MSYFTETLDETMSILERGSAKQQKQRTKDLIAQDRATDKRNALKNKALNALDKDDDDYAADRSKYNAMHRTYLAGSDHHEYEKKYGGKNSARINKYY